MEPIRFLTIDPSSNEIGIAILDVDPVTFDIVDIKTHYINIRKHVSSNDIYEPLTYRMDEYYDRLKILFEEYNPRVMAYERGFINKKAPGAFGPINTCTTLSSRVAIKHNRFIRITQFSPGQVKNAMGQKGNCGKDEMLAGCKRHPILTRFVVPDYVTEHEIDAIAVGLCAVEYYKKNKVLLF